MNAAISALVTVVSVGIVLGVCVLGVNHVMGEWSIIVWVIAGWAAFMTVMRAINS